MAAQPGEWTIADLLALPDDENRYELVDGHLVVTPPPPPWHQAIGARLLVQLARQCPAEWEPIYESLLAYGRTARVPDVLVVRSSALQDRHRSHLVPADVGLVVEIVSRSSRRRDRLDKPAEYAAQGIPLMWRVELEPDVVVHPFRLEGRSWVASAVVEHEGLVPVPWGEIELDLGRLRA